MIFAKEIYKNHDINVLFDKNRNLINLNHHMTFNIVTFTEETYLNHGWSKVAPKELTTWK